jgi:hypothetical protein
MVVKKPRMIQAKANGILPNILLYLTGLKKSETRLSNVNREE